MRGRPVVIVFAKAPRLGAVKTRLAGDIGAPAAQRFQREVARSLVRRLARQGCWRLVLAVTPDRYRDQGRFWPLEVERLAQGPGDLGRRMARALRRFLPAPVVLVGSDIPALRPGHLRRAFRALGQNDVVFGPASDGGYWLVGTRGRIAPERFFRGVRWSTPEALADTLRNLGPVRRVSLVDELDDVDSGTDYESWKSDAGR
jgi:hypothetical protein